jgi:alpha-1,6-mannosyltransferase
MALVIIHCLIVTLSREFNYDAPLRTYPVISFVVLEVLAGAIYLCLVWLIPRSRAQPWLLVLVLGVGLVMRATTLFSTPILEDDFYRYLWDGAVVAAGHDPYRHSPAEVLSADADSDVELAALAAIADDEMSVVRRINHPHLTTLYPPLAQGAFAFGASVEPFSLGVWRLILLLFEGATVVLLFLILRRLQRSPLWLAIYLWNPLVIKEFVNSAHMDALLLPFLVGAVLLMLVDRHWFASLCLSLAAGIKLWPVLLLPTMLRPLLGEPRKLAVVTAAFLVGFSATAWWAVSQSGGDTGLTAYTVNWKMNDAFFIAFDWLVGKTLLLLDFQWVDGGSVSRALVAATVVWLAVWINRQAAADGQAICTRFLVVTAIVFLLSPAQFPWYYTWLVPFLVLVPSPALLLLTPLLPLYYLRFYLDFRAQAQLFDYGIVWLEYVPVWVLLACEWWFAGQRRAWHRLEARQP